MTRLSGGIFSGLFLCAAVISACGSGGSITGTMPATMPRQAAQQHAMSLGSHWASIFFAVTAPMTGKHEHRAVVVLVNGAIINISLSPRSPSCRTADRGKALVCSVSVPAVPGNHSGKMALLQAAAEMPKALRGTAFAITAVANKTNAVVITLDRGSSFPAHQYLIAGQTGSEVAPHSKPWGCDALKNPQCFDYPTRGDDF